MSSKEIQLGEGRSRSILGNRMFSRGNGGRGGQSSQLDRKGGIKLAASDLPMICQ